MVAYGNCTARPYHFLGVGPDRTIMNLRSIDLTHHTNLSSWDPQIGDIIIWHGWLQHWFGVVSNVIREDHSVEIIRKGIPLLLFAMIPEEHDKNKIKISVGDIKSSTGGKYAAVRANKNNLIWYV